VQSESTDLPDKRFANQFKGESHEKTTGVLARLVALGGSPSHHRQPQHHQLRQHWQHSRADLAGKWNIALRGTTGCGRSHHGKSGVTLNTSGVGNWNPRHATANAGDSSLPLKPFTIHNHDRPTAAATGPAFPAVSALRLGNSRFRSLRTVPKSTWVRCPGRPTRSTSSKAVAILASPSGHIDIADLTGSWQ